MEERIKLFGATVKMRRFGGIDGYEIWAELGLHKPDYVKHRIAVLIPTVNATFTLQSSVNVLRDISPNEADYDVKHPKGDLAFVRCDRACWKEIEDDSIVCSAGVQDQCFSFTYYVTAAWIPPVLVDSGLIRFWMFRSSARVPPPRLPPPLLLPFPPPEPMKAPASPPIELLDFVTEAEAETLFSILDEAFSSI